jgi:hypothetical protein
LFPEGGQSEIQAKSLPEIGSKMDTDYSSHQNAKHIWLISVLKRAPKTAASPKKIP